MKIPILSRENKTLKLIRGLQKKKGRTDSGLYFVEGVRIVREALQDAEAQIECLVVSQSFEEKNQSFVDDLDKNGKTVYIVKDGLFSDLCDTETPQGIAAVLHMTKPTIQPQTLSYLLVLDGVSEPGNLGTMIRTAEAAGIEAVLLLKGCVDLYNPKVVRSTMGSLFRVPCVTGLEPSYLKELQSQGFQLIATALEDSVPLTEGVVTGNRAIVIGSEADGVSEEILKMADVRLRIPMEGKVESLNAAVAAGIVMYRFKG